MNGFFREDDVYDKFPCPTVFLPDIPEYHVLFSLMVDPRSYVNLIVPSEIKKGYYDILDYYLRPSRWSYGDFCHLMLNSVMAPNPVSRFLMSMMYKSEMQGQNKLWFGRIIICLKPSISLSLKRRMYRHPIIMHTTSIARSCSCSRTRTTAIRKSQHKPCVRVADCPTFFRRLQSTARHTWKATRSTPSDFGTYCKITRISMKCGFADPGHPPNSSPPQSRRGSQQSVMLFASITSEDDVKLFKFHLDDLNAKRAEEAERSAAGRIA